MTVTLGRRGLAGTSESGLTYLSLAAQSLAVEARLLAVPVFVEAVSTAHVPDVASLADAVRRGQLAIATPSTGDIDVDRS